MFFDQSRFQEQSLQLAARRDPGDAPRLLSQPDQLAGLFSTLLVVAPNTLAEVDRLPDVEDLIARIAEKVHARPIRQRSQPSSHFVGRAAEVGDSIDNSGHRWR